MALIGNPVLTQPRVERETRKYHYGFTWVDQHRLNTTRVYECDANDASATIPSAGRAGTPVHYVSTPKGRGNRYWRAQLVTFQSGTWTPAY